MKKLKHKGTLQKAARPGDSFDRVAGKIAHDFNNQLIVISAYAELTLEALPENDRLRGNLHEILKASRRAANLTEELLAFDCKAMRKVLNGRGKLEGGEEELGSLRGTESS